MRSNQIVFQFETLVVIPFLVGNLIMFAYFYPDIIDNASILFYERFGWISLMLIFLLVFGRINQFDTIYFDEEGRTVRISYVLVAIAFISLILIRFLLRDLILITW